MVAARLSLDHRGLLLQRADRPARFDSAWHDDADRSPRQSPGGWWLAFGDRESSQTDGPEGMSLLRTFGSRRGAHFQRGPGGKCRSEEHTSELQSLRHLVCRLLLEKNH